MANLHFFKKTLTTAAGNTRAGLTFVLLSALTLSQIRARTRNLFTGERQRFIFTDKRFVRHNAGHNLCLRPLENIQILTEQAQGKNSLKIKKLHLYMPLYLRFKGFYRVLVHRHILFIPKALNKRLQGRTDGLQAISFRLKLYNFWFIGIAFWTLSLKLWYRMQKYSFTGNSEETVKSKQQRHISLLLFLPDIPLYI